MGIWLRRRLFFYIVIPLTGILSLKVYAQQPIYRGSVPRSKILFDFGWRFHRGGAEGAYLPDFNDGKWQEIDLPHDWSIEDIPGTHSPFDSNAVNQVSGGFTSGGVGWYRKTFIVPDSEKGKIIQVQFDGVYMNADVWINGHHLGNHPYGYTGFWFDITNEIRFGEKNVLAVQVKNEGLNSRWYAGSGIYRHVWLIYMNPIHVKHGELVITTAEADKYSGKINIKTTIKNQMDHPAEITLVTHILDMHNLELTKVISRQSIPQDSVYLFDQNMTVKYPHLWSLDSPYRYTALTEVYNNQQLSDELKTKFGIRTISFDALNGFRLNGKSMKLRGGCVHENNGPLGARAYNRAEIRKVELLKSVGFNAIRCAHNPPAPAFLNACDSLGMLVIDEAFDTWETGKTPFDYHLYFHDWWKKDIRSMILRDRNHPSVIMWSIGNEVPDMDNPQVAKLAHQLANEVRSLDPTRPVTAAVNNPDSKKDPFFSALDVCGYNYGLYRRNYYLEGHQNNAKRIMFGSESFPPEAFDYWMAVKDHPWIIGDFVWTAWDYMGESGIGWFNWPQLQSYYPWHLAYTGDFDVCGWRRPQSYYREALWKKDELSLFVKPPEPSFPMDLNHGQWSKWHWKDVVASWNWNGHEGKSLEVYVYSSCKEVELFLNGKSLGKKETNRSTRFMAAWDVPYQSGELKAVGYDGKEEVAKSILKTAGQPVHIHVIADRHKIIANGEDLSYITVELTDEKGIRNPMAENMLHFKISGPGVIAGIGNANPVDTESYQAPQHKAWRGRCMVIIKSERTAGNITLTVSSDGLSSSSIKIESD